jgi:hypothetical protein
VHNDNERQKATAIRTRAALLIAPVAKFCDTFLRATKLQLRPQRLVLFFAPLDISAAFAAFIGKVTEMLSINGTAMQTTQREFHRAAVGCPSITGSRSRPVAKNYRDFGTELDR